MAELRYVDWDGLVYYDGKIKKHLEDKLENCIKMGGMTSFEELPSPSFQNVNYIYKVAEEFTSNNYFEKPGFTYKAGTWVQVTDINDVYLYTIFNEEDVSPSNPIDPGTIDLTNYYTKDEVEGIVAELPTKEYVNQAIEDAIDSVEIDTTGLVTKEEFEVVQQQSAANNALIVQFGEEIFDINQRIDNITTPDLTGYATESFVTEKISEIDIPSTEGLATETFVHEMIAKAELEDKEADLEAYYTKDQVNALIPDVSDFAKRDEIPSVDGFATTDYVDEKIAKITPPTVDLDGYATEDWVNEQGFIKEVPGEFVTESELDAKGYLTSHQSLEDYAKKTDIPDVSEFLTSIPDEYVTTDELSEYALKKDIPTDYLKSVPDEYITEDELNEKGFSTFSGSYNDLTDKPEIPSIDGLATTAYVDNKIGEVKVPTNVSELTNDVGYITASDIPDTSNFITMKDVEDKGYLTEHQSLDEYAKKSDIPTDYLTPSDIENKADKSDLNGLATEQYVSDRISEINIPDTSDFLTEIPEEYVTSAELEAEGFLKEHQDLSDYAKKSDIPNVDDFITMSDVEGKGFLTEVPSEYITEDELSAKGYITDVSGKADVDHTHSYNDLTDTPTIPSIDGLATEQYVDDAISNIDIPTVDTSKFVTSDALIEALGTKANDVLFTEDYRVGSPIGLFAQDDPVQGMTLTEIITRILGLTLYVPDTPGNVPDATPDYIKAIISNEMHAYTLDGTGTYTFIEAETDSFYKQMTPEESYGASTENFFYQIIDPDTNELLESGYQVKTVEDSEYWLTVAIPSTITNFHIEQFNQFATGDDKWGRLTGCKLVPNDDQPLDGYTVYSAENFDGGITIRIVID